MEIKGEHLIAAERSRVWKGLNDPEILRNSIAGCESIVKDSDTSFTARMVARIGPVKAAFDGVVTLSNIDPPSGYVISGSGKSPVGVATGVAEVKLIAEGERSTRLQYTARAEVGGKLAQIGSRLIDSVARKMADDFFSRFNATMSSSVPSSLPTPRRKSPFVVEVDLRWAVAVLVAVIIAYWLGRGWISR